MRNAREEPSDVTPLKNAEDVPAHPPWLDGSKEDCFRTGIACGIATSAVTLFFACAITIIVLFGLG